MWSGDELVIGEGQDPGNESSVILMRTNPIITSEVVSEGNEMYVMFTVTSPDPGMSSSGFSAEVLQYNPKGMNLALKTIGTYFLKSLIYCK